MGNACILLGTIIMGQVSGYTGHQGDVQGPSLHLSGVEGVDLSWLSELRVHGDAQHLTGQLVQARSTLLKAISGRHTKVNCSWEKKRALYFPLCSEASPP